MYVKSWSEATLDSCQGVAYFQSARTNASQVDIAIVTSQSCIQRVRPVTSHIESPRHTGIEFAGCVTIRISGACMCAPWIRIRCKEVTRNVGFIAASTGVDVNPLGTSCGIRLGTFQVI